MIAPIWICHVNYKNTRCFLLHPNNYRQVSKKICSLYLCPHSKISNNFVGPLNFAQATPSWLMALVGHKWYKCSHSCFMQPTAKLCKCGKWFNMWAQTVNHSSCLSAASSLRLQQLFLTCLKCCHFKLMKCHDSTPLFRIITYFNFKHLWIFFSFKWQVDAEIIFKVSNVIKTAAWEILWLMEKPV